MSPLNVMFVAGREDGGVTLAFRNLTAPEDSDPNHRSLGDLAQKLAAEIVAAVIKRDDCQAIQDH
jgi:hypothetical protein